MGFISQSALRLSDRYAAWDSERRFSVPGVQVTDPKAAQCGEVLKGVLRPPDCKLFGKECTPEQSGRRADGVVGRIVRGLLHLRSSENRGGGAMGVSPTGVRVIEPDGREDGFRDPRIEMAHGAGGKASRRLIEGLIAPLLMEASARTARRRRHRRRRRRAAGGDLRQLRGDASAVSRAARLASWRSTAPSTTWPWRAHGRSACWSRSCSRPGCRRNVLEAEVRAMGDAARRAGVRILGGDTKVVEHGKADSHVRHDHRLR